MPTMFGFHNFYDLNSDPILARYHKLSFNTYFKHDLARCRITCHHIYLKQLHFHVQAFYLLLRSIKVYIKKKIKIIITYFVRFMNEKEIVLNTQISLQSVGILRDMVTSIH